MHIGLDIGGSRVKIAWRSAPGERVHFGGLDSQQIADPADWVERLYRALPRAAQQALDSGRLHAVGIGVAGEVREPGTVVQSPNLPAWREIAVAKQLGAALDVPVIVENDAHMAGVALLAHPEWVGGEVDNVFVFTLGTGVGGAWLLDSALYRRPEGGEAEIGHIPVVPDGRLCACGRRGCLEAYAGGRSMLKIYAERSGRSLDNVAALDERAAGGDKAARSVLAEAGTTLGWACATLGNVLATRTFVFAGGVAHARPRLLPTIREGFAAQAFASSLKRARFRFPSRRENLGVLGALAAAEWRGGYRLRCQPDQPRPNEHA